MASPPALPPPHPPAPPAPPPHPFDTSASPSAVKRTQKASCLQSLSTRSIDAERPVVHIDPATGKADEFEISEASDSRTKKKLLQTVGEKWRQFKSDLTKKWALAADQDGVDDTVCEKYGISKEKWAQFCQTCRDPSWEKLLAEKTKKKLEEAAQSGSVDGVIDPPSPVRRHMKIPLRSRRHRDPSSPMDVRMFSPLLLDVQSTLDVSVLLEPVSPSSNTSDWLHGSHDIVQPDAVPVSVLDAISETSTAFGASDRCGLYIEANPARLVAQGRVCERSTIVHKTPLLPGQVKVGVEEVKDPDVAVPVPTDEQNHLKSRIQRHLIKTSMRAENSDIYGFLEPQSIQRSGKSQFETESYIKSWMQSSNRDVYLGAYLNGPDNYLKGIINSALKGLDDALQSKSKASARWIVVKCNRQKGSTECGYYVMHWMSTIILGSFKNNWEAVRLFQTNLIFL
ncbi:hypothetical protein HKD37_17G048725 [Glycine soja]